MKGLLPFALVLLSASSAGAQGFETSLVAGYTTPGNLDPQAIGITDLNVEGSFTWGASVAYFLSPRVGIEASWVRQQSALEIGTPSGSAEMFDLDVDHLYASVVWQLGQEPSPFRPFVAAGIGAALMSAPQLDDETKLAFSVATGLRWMPARRTGARLQLRYVPTRLGDSGSDFCDPFGFCEDWLHQVELTGGVVVRF